MILRYAFKFKFSNVLRILDQIISKTISLIQTLIFSNLMNSSKKSSQNVDEFAWFIFQHLSFNVVVLPSA